VIALAVVAALAILFAVSVWATVRELRKNDAALSAELDRLADQTESEAGEARLLSAVTSHRFSPNGSRLATEAAVNILHRRAESEDFRRLFLNYVRSVALGQVAKDFAYRQSLLLLTISRSAPVKDFVLGMARWYYGSARQNGVLTIYDEQAIQNDLLTYQHAEPPEGYPVSLRDVLNADVERRKSEETERKAGVAETTAVLIVGAFAAVFAGYLIVSRVTTTSDSPSVTSSQQLGAAENDEAPAVPVTKNLVSTPPDPGPLPPSEHVMAITVAQNFVKDRLNPPSSASFPRGFSRLVAQ
jgi:hypothetical protein